MATASIEFSAVALANYGGSSIYGRSVRQESLAVSGSTATSAACTAPQLAAAGGPGTAFLARVATDIDCWVASGTTPDPTLQDATAASSARRYLPAGQEMAVMLAVGDKVAVKAFS